MYNFKEIEEKWNKYWEENQTFKTDVWDFSKPKYYCLDMFPYPSGAGLHVGHLIGYVASDAMARFKRMQGFNVLHPMGYDAFGLPAEQYAIKTGNNPNGFTQKNIENFRKQLHKTGLSIDWNRELSTCDPSYYRFTQWIVEQLYKNNLMKLKDMEVNWCEELGTVLANDEVIDGKSERGGYPVVKRKMKQWVVDIPQYAQKLLDGLNEIDWPESTKISERNWIGKSEGAVLNFKVKNTNFNFDVFTTRIDTLFGATYCVLAPDHELVKKITTKEQQEQVQNYVLECAKKTDIERTDTSKEKTGVFTGAYAINPANGKELPIWIADYVLSSYGTGAIMAVPAHDERDFAFATKFGLEIIPVLSGGLEGECFVGDGKHINSGFIDGLDTQTAKQKMIDWAEKEKIGYAKTTYKIREWIFARQHYWGEPMPMMYDEQGNVHLVPENELPLTLPEVKDYKPNGGLSPLANAPEWMNIKIDGKKFTREINTMPGSAGSSWYFLRYIDPKNEKEIGDKKLLEHWMPVDLYVGGAEHAVGHLLYARMWNKFLCEQGFHSHTEPFKRLAHPGMMLAADRRKMSKRWGNVVTPDEVIAEFGADVLRLYEMFMCPISDTRPWNHENISGVQRFLEKVWFIYNETNKVKDEPNKNLDKIFNQTVKKVTQDYEALSFNTAISQMMIFVNAVSKEDVFPKEYAKQFIKLLNPLAPYVTEEIWSTIFGEKKTIAYEQWPTYDESKLAETEVEIVVQINGKVRDKLTVLVDENDEQVKQKALELESIKKQLLGKEIKKVVIIKNKLVNIVAI